jgi:cytochrome c biogenesis protein CcmG/thiol:disulfide interchange protein DsbE
MENVDGLALTQWVEEQTARLAPPAAWTPDLVAARARAAELLQAASRRSRYARIALVTASSLVAAVLLVSPNARVLAEQCWRCFAGPRVDATLNSSSAARNLAPNFALVDSRGATLRLSDYTGKVVLLDFWATWCPPCKAEMPWFAEFERRYKDRGLVVVGVSIDEDGWKSVTPFLARNPVNHRIVVGDEEIVKNYAVENVPATFLIDRSGKIAATHVGLTDRGALENEIRTLLQQ